MGVLKGWNHGYAPTEAVSDDFIYTYQIPTAAYSVNGLITAGAEY